MITYVAKKPTGQIKAWSVGKEKEKVKKECEQQIFNYLDQKRKEGTLGLDEVIKIIWLHLLICT
jgi:hypothetical protein